MNHSSISNSNAVILTIKEWVIAVVLLVGICTIVHVGWFRWERFKPGPDYRPPCWAEKMTDYWSHFRWSRYAARSNYKVFLIGDSVIWGQEVDSDHTISHYLNEQHGEEIFANLGIDALFQSAFPGIIKYYGKYYSNLIIQFSPHWIRDVNNDLRGNRERFYHPRLVPQFHPRIHYNDYTLNERLSYKIENYIGIFPLVRHMMVNYFDNKNVSAWMMEHPYQSPFRAVTFKVGEGIIP